MSVRNAVCQTAGQDGYNAMRTSRHNDTKQHQSLEVSSDFRAFSLRKMGNMGMEKFT
jgi:hypothetical protein